MLQCAACDNQSLFQLDSQSVGLIHPLAQIPDLLEPVYSETDAFLVQESQIKIDEIQLVTAACRPDFEIFKCNRNGFNSIKTSSFHFYLNCSFSVQTVSFVRGAVRLVHFLVWPKETGSFWTFPNDERLNAESSPESASALKADWLFTFHHSPPNQISKSEFSLELFTFRKVWNWKLWFSEIQKRNPNYSLFNRVYSNS